MIVHGGLQGLRAMPKNTIRSRPISAIARVLTRTKLRVVCFHEVNDPRSFDRQMAWLSERFTVIDAADVAGAARSDCELPTNSAWVTFDDGHPTVISHALPILRRYGVRASLFVCPGLIETNQPFWWDVILRCDIADLNRLLDSPVGSLEAAVVHLKTVSDNDRRAVVDALSVDSDVRNQVTIEDLRLWLNSGNSIGNHTWDHPCLDRATATEQRRQVLDADDWIRSIFDDWEPTFAYPNGNWTNAVERTLTSLDYDLALLHDHQISDPNTDHLRVSRLHTEADDELGRFRSIVSGTQPALKKALGRHLSSAG